MISKSLVNSKLKIIWIFFDPSFDGGGDVTKLFICLLLRPEFPLFVAALFEAVPIFLLVCTVLVIICRSVVVTEDLVVNFSADLCVVIDIGLLVFCIVVVIIG